MTPQRPVCPVCKRASQDRFRPFCSTRCAQVDLGRWLGGGYTVPGSDGDAIAEDNADPSEFSPKR